MGPQVFQSPRRDVLGGFDDAASGDEDQREREVGGRLRQHAGRIADRDASRGAGREIDVVDPDGHLRHHLELRSRRLEHGFVDAVGDQADQAVDAANMFKQVVAPGREVARPDV